jgi:hypothetical protein
MKITKARFIILFIVVLPLAVILLIRTFINTVNFISVNFLPHPEWEEWKKQTSPLTSEQKNLLCENFALSEESICARENVYGPDFYPYIVNALHPIEEFSPYGIGPDPATYEEVEEKLGVFKIECGPNRPGSALLRSDDYQFFVCRYDLRGDGANILSIFFITEENIVMRVVGPVGTDPY